MTIDRAQGELQEVGRGSQPTFATTQSHRTAKRVLLAPIAPLVKRWAFAGEPTERKAQAARWLVEPWLTATARRYERAVEPDLVFSGDTQTVLGRYVYLFGTWQPNLTAFLASRLRRGRTFVDVGANVGWFTLQGARHVGRTGKVVAIEASPDLACQVKNVVERNQARNVRVVNAAVWSGPGMVDIHPGPAENPGTTSISPGHEVRCDTLMSLLTDQETATCQLVKIDVEGSEREVVRGIDPDRFPQDTEFVIELSPSSAGEILARFTGYTPFLLPNSYRMAHYMLDRPPESLERLWRIDDIVDVVLSRADAVNLERDFPASRSVTAPYERSPRRDLWAKR